MGGRGVRGRSEAACLYVPIQRQHAGGCQTVLPLYSLLKAPHHAEFYLPILT